MHIWDTGTATHPPMRSLNSPPASALTWPDTLLICPCFKSGESLISSTLGGVVDYHPTNEGPDHRLSNSRSLPPFPLQLVSPRPAPVHRTQPLRCKTSVKQPDCRLVFTPTLWRCILFMSLCPTRCEKECNSSREFLASALLPLVRTVSTHTASVKCHHHILCTDRKSDDSTSRAGSKRGTTDCSWQAPPNERKFDAADAITHLHALLDSNMQSYVSVEFSAIAASNTSTCPQLRARHPSTSANYTSRTPLYEQNSMATSCPTSGHPSTIYAMPCVSRAVSVAPPGVARTNHMPGSQQPRTRKPPE